MKKGRKSCELRIPFDPLQEYLYRRQVKQRRRLPGCIYPIWHLLRGKSRHGEFPLVFVREYFLTRGYKVLFSDSGGETSENFICASYPVLRRAKPLHPAYRRMARIFGLERLNEFNNIAEKAKRRRKNGSNRGGGDPDLFVYKGNGRRIRFFVEAKHKDKLLTNQKVVFRLIKKHLRCPVKVFRIYSQATVQKKVRS
jgi:hypothetical protein